MEVQLYVYDLSKGLARSMSLPLLGINIDAVYHTAVVLGGVEYFYGAGVQTCYPGATHHGRPMEVIPLGTTDLPLDVVREYLESLKQIYTAESYDLFLHNCNNFSNDFVMFLVGKGIPDHITSLPQTVLNTPFGQMLKPQLDAAMRGITQAPVPPSVVPQQSTRPTSMRNGAAAIPHLSITSNGASPGLIANGHAAVSSVPIEGTVHNVTSVREVESLLASAVKSCAVIFFTSSTCPPCKIVYPAYDELAAEAGNKAVLIKVDLSKAYDVSAKYGVRATPTFMTFLKGEKENEWSGANESQLRGNVNMLIQMAHPPHPHTNLKLPSLQRANLNPVTYAKMPPLDKLIAKMGDAGKATTVKDVQNFVVQRETSGAREAPLPDLAAFSSFIRTSTSVLPPELIFTVVDLLRITLVDPRVSGYFAEEHNHNTLVPLLGYVNNLPTCPYNLRIVTLQMTCNLFTTPLYPPQILSSPILSAPTILLLSTSLLDSKHPNVRVAAASLAFNIAAHNHKQRLQNDCETLPESQQVEIVASLLEAISAETESEEGLKGLLLALGLMVYCAPVEGEVVDVCKAMDAGGTVSGKEARFGKDGLVGEIGGELLGKGL
ncbi:MAG: hypothetical protein M1830_000388 [Pleopsidium flavum]|nr:MAG: hypothetical protein M1830_000388 [Pleopsidium flavum]